MDGMDSNVTTQYNVINARSMAILAGNAQTLQYLIYLDTKCQ